MSMVSPRVSVCVPTHNGAAYLTEALASLEAQDFEAMEVIIADDASSDRTLAIAEEFAARTRFPCRILRHQPSTPADNWNFAADQARGEYLKFLFQDDLLYPAHVRRLVEAAERHPEITLVFAARDILFDEGAARSEVAHGMRRGCADLHEGFARLREIQPGSDLLRDARLLANGWNKIGEPSCTLMRRGAFSAAGGFDPAFRQLVDIDLYLRLMAAGSVAFVPERLSGFRVHDRQLSVAHAHSGISVREEAAFARKQLAGPLRRLFAPAALRQLEWSSQGRLGQVPGPLKRIRHGIKGWARRLWQRCFSPSCPPSQNEPLRTTMEALSHASDSGVPFSSKAYGDSVLGTAEKSGRLISPEAFLQVELQAGISADNPDFRNLARVTARQMRWRGIRTVLDYGAGTGVYAAAFRQAGFETFAFEIWEAHRAYIRDKLPEVRLVDEPLTTDLMLLIETAEHMTDEEISSLFARVRPARILFSSTSQRTDWDAEWGHVNIKSQPDWDVFFSGLGYDLAEPLGLPTSWSKLYRRQDAAPLRLSLRERWRKSLSRRR